MKCGVHRTDNQDNGADARALVTAGVPGPAPRARGRLMCWLDRCGCSVPGVKVQLILIIQRSTRLLGVVARHGRSWKMVRPPILLSLDP